MRWCILLALVAPVAAATGLAQVTPLVGHWLNP